MSTQQYVVHLNEAVVTFDGQPEELLLTNWKALEPRSSQGLALAEATVVDQIHAVRYHLAFVARERGLTVNVVAVEPLKVPFPPVSQ